MAGLQRPNVAQLGYNNPTGIMLTKINRTWTERKHCSHENSSPLPTPLSRKSEERKCENMAEYIAEIHL